MAEQEQNAHRVDTDSPVPDQFMSPPTADMVGQALADAANEIPVGQRFGPYRVTGFVASGGMGAVYRAVRDDGQFDKQVAVKILHRPFAKPGETDVVAREQQILAKLEHQGIARLLDAGVTDFGFAYLIMEFVDGLPIHEYCRRRGMSLRDRCHLFLKVCEAVQYAHQRMVLHRDLKPANILVTADGQPKVVDFGIAKLVDDAAGDALTVTLAHAGTPRYAAPEIFRGQAATTVTDVYALGVILYEMLADTLPYDLSRLSAAEAERVVCDVDPRPPSESTKHALHRSTLKGDLDTIVLHAMHKDPTRRYASVEQLADDIDRHLNHYPVRARPDSAVYRAQRFVKRRKVLVVLLVLVFAAPLAGIAISTVGYVAARRSAHRAAVEAERAQEVTDFLALTLAEVDPLNARSREVTLPEILASASARIATDFDDDPVVHATLARTIGHSFRRLGMYPEARKHLERSVELLRDVRESSPAVLIDSLEALAGLYEADSNSQEAYDLFVEALALREKIGDADIVATLTKLARTASSLNRIEDAITHQREAIALLRKHENPDASTLANALHGLADLEAQRGKTDVAEGLHRDALDMEKKQLGETHAQTAAGHHKYARLLIRAGRFEEADAELKRSVSILATTVPEQPTRQINPLLDQAYVHGKLERLESADALYQRALALSDPLPADHWLFAIVRHRYIGFLIKQDRHGEALPLAESVASALSAMLGEDHANTITSRERVNQIKKIIDPIEQTDD